MQNISDNIPIGTNTECHEDEPNIGEMVDDILVNGFCAKSGLTLDEVLETTETDVAQYAAILKYLITYQSLKAKELARKYVGQLVYKRLEELYK
tara:strand:+ start:528 stop:809 length:282 start_codon:yes stop_codon:yes gene_type:complete